MLGATLLVTAGTHNNFTPYDVKIVPQFGDVRPRAGFILLTDRIRSYPAPLAPSFLHAVISPSPRDVPDIIWTASGGVGIEPSPSFGFALPPQAADASIDRAGVIGPFTITAALGPPVNVKATVGGFAYASVVIGCAQGNAPGVRYDASGSPHGAARLDDADMYITGPVNEAQALWDICPPAFHDPTAKTYTLHVPFGGVAINADVDRFTAVTARDWRNAARATSFAVSALHGTLLLRTRSNRLVKTLARIVNDNTIEGPTLTADTTDVFADTLSLRSPVMTQVAIPERSATRAATLCCTDAGLIAEP